MMTARVKSQRGQWQPKKSRSSNSALDRWHEKSRGPKTHRTKKILRKGGLFGAGGNTGLKWWWWFCITQLLPSALASRTVPLKFGREYARESVDNSFLAPKWKIQLLYVFCVYVCVRDSSVVSDFDYSFLLESPI